MLEYCLHLLLRYTGKMTLLFMGLLLFSQLLFGILLRGQIDWDSFLYAAGMCAIAVLLLYISLAEKKKKYKKQGTFLLYY